jgi:hypothetical protein
MTLTQFQKGLIIIQRETERSLQGRCLHDASIDLIPKANEKQGATLSITVAGKLATQLFTYREIEDSGEAIDAPAAHKLRNLMSVFEGSPIRKGSATPLGLDPQAAAERSCKTISDSKPGGFKNDPNDPTSPNEAIERSREALRQASGVYSKKYGKP